MKILIASDIHGSNYYADKVAQLFLSEQADKLILLGDIYNHGPRNPLPKDYAPMKVAETLNGLKDNLIVIKGNCDSEVDTMISEFDFVENVCVTVNNKVFFLSHGHVYNEDCMPKTNFDGIIYGHFHTGFIKKVNDKIIANPGSTSLPKNNTTNSYILLTDSEMLLKDVDGNIIDKINL